MSNNNNMREISSEEKESTISTPATSIYEPNPNNQKVEELSPDEERGATPELEVEYASGFKLAVVVMALALSVFLISLDMTIVATAIPKITDVSFHKRAFDSGMY
jgi:MFS transporter, DHA2 family, glioxin efflux transporter